MERTESEKLMNRIKELLSLDENRTHLGMEEHGDVIRIYCNNFHITHKDITSDTLNDIEEAYQGEYRNGKEFAEQLVDDTGMLSNVPDNIRFYFDYEAFARDLFMGDYWIEEGHVFRNL
jgi:antirestriction protein